MTRIRLEKEFLNRSNWANKKDFYCSGGVYSASSSKRFRSSFVGDDAGIDARKLVVEIRIELETKSFELRVSIYERLYEPYHR
jgi:hypothetical protein